MAEDIDLNFRPKSYFGPRRLEQYLISKVKGAVVKARLEALSEEGRHAEVASLLGDEGISEADTKALEGVHPMFMGGNYLPDTDDGEVEIARIEIASTTFDVTCVFARAEKGLIRYRVVDEYEGDTLSGPNEMTSDRPLTLGELTDFFLNAWSLVDVLEMNFEDDVESALGFFIARSEFYPDLDTLCRQRVIEAFPVRSDEDERRPLGVKAERRSTSPAEQSSRPDVVSITLQLPSAGRDPHEARRRCRLPLPDEPRITGGGRYLSVEPSSHHRHALDELGELARRRMPENVLVSSEALKEHGPGKDRHADARHGQCAIDELLRQSERWIGDDPVVRGRFEGATQKVTDWAIPIVDRRRTKRPIRSTPPACGTCDHGRRRAPGSSWSRGLPCQ